MAIAATNLLCGFAKEIDGMTPPMVPANTASVRGWTMRLTGISEYAENLDSAELAAFAERLNEPIASLHAYLHRWEKILRAKDRVLLDYETLPGDEHAIESVAILLERAIHAQRVAVKLLPDRSA